MASRDNPHSCWCKNARCKGIMCEATLQQEQEHSCFTQVKLKRRADGTKYIKIKRGCTTNCQALSNPLTFQQCCSSLLCNAGNLNVTHDNATILAVEQLPMDTLSGEEILKAFVTFPPGTGLTPNTSVECECTFLSQQCVLLCGYIFLQAGY